MTFGLAGLEELPLFPIMMLSQESKKSEWLSKKRQMQGAQLSRNEAYSGTPQ
jgi:hypothetical protein